MSGKAWGNKIMGKCPSCGSNGTLFVASDGYITCSLLVCPNPAAAADLFLTDTPPEPVRPVRPVWATDSPYWQTTADKVREHGLDWWSSTYGRLPAAEVRPDISGHVRLIAREPARTVTVTLPANLTSDEVFDAYRAAQEDAT